MHSKIAPALNTIGIMYTKLLYCYWMCSSFNMRCEKEKTHSHNVRWLELDIGKYPFKVLRRKKMLISCKIYCLYLFSYFFFLRASIPFFSILKEKYVLVFTSGAFSSLNLALCFYPHSIHGKKKHPQAICDH